MDKKIIARNFSQCASTYDRYAQVQRIAAAKLLDKVKENGFRSILEIGCGTGNYTLLLRNKFKHAGLKAIDISEAMVARAREKLKDSEVEFVICDAEEIEFQESFDLVTSNGCLQWFTDLRAAIQRYRMSLSKGGVISFSIFGPKTYRELNTALRRSLKEYSVPASRFPEAAEIKDILRENFQGIDLEEDIYTEVLPSLKDLMRKIKYTGTRGQGNNGKIFLVPRLLDKIERFYLDKFGQIQATYQVFYCRGIKA
jgi:malonyl-CoA O-methyltransferase